MLQNISMLHVLPLPGMKQRIVSLLAELFHVSVDYLLDDDISEITLSDKSTAQKSEHYLLTHFHRLSNSSKKELLNFLQYLEQRDESARSKSAL